MRYRIDIGHVVVMPSPGGPPIPYIVVRLLPLVSEARSRRFWSRTRSTMTYNGLPRPVSPLARIRHSERIAAGVDPQG
jgi:hypothetical protein